jgi:hypothetical protein
MRMDTNTPQVPLSGFDAKSMCIVEWTWWDSGTVKRVEDADCCLDTSPHECVHIALQS